MNEELKTLQEAVYEAYFTHLDLKAKLDNALHEFYEERYNLFMYDVFFINSDFATVWNVGEETLVQIIQFRVDGVLLEALHSDKNNPHRFALTERHMYLFSTMQKVG